MQNRTKLVGGIVFAVIALAGHLELFPWIPLAVQQGIELVGFLLTAYTFYTVNPTASTAQVPTLIDPKKGK